MIRIHSVNNRARRFPRPLLIVCFAALGIASAVCAAPTLESVSPRGLQIGEVTRITINGQQLGPNPRVYLDLDGEYQQVIVDRRDDRLVADVTVATHVPAGIYPLRISTDVGLSNAMVVGLDRLPQRPFQEQLDSLPVALHGELTGDRILRVRFNGQANEPIVIDIEGQRLGSKLRPVIRLLDSTGRQIASARPAEQIAGDARLETLLPHSGEFEVELHDVVYQGPGPGWFRWKLGQLKYADLVYPPALSWLSDAEVEFALSNLSTAVRVPVIPDIGTSVRRVPWPGNSDVIYTAAAPRVTISPFGTAEYREKQLKDDIIADVPAGISGRLMEPGEQDEYTFNVMPKSNLRFEIHSQRLGSPLDAVLVVATRDGKQLGRSDDQAGTRDPGMDIEIPADISAVVARVSSLLRQSGRDHIYRLTVVPRTAKWKLNTSVDRVNIPSGDRQVIEVEIDRGGSQGRLDLQLPAGLRGVVNLETPLIFPQDEIGLLALEAAEATRGVYSAAIVGFDSTSSVAGPVVNLSSAAFPGSEYQPELRESLALSITPPNPISIDWATEMQSFQLARGTRQRVPVKVHRRAEGSGKIRLSLLTTQKLPMKQEGNKQVPDLERWLRLEGTPVVAAGELTAALEVNSPPELPRHSWAFVVKAEWLSDDEKQVRATAYTRVQRADTIDPLQLSVELPQELAVTAGNDEPVKIKGSIERHAGYDYRVQLTLQGLPKEVKLSPAIVAANETDFVMPVSFEKETAPGDFKDVRLVASFVDADESIKDVRSRSNPFTLKINKPE